MKSSSAGAAIYVRSSLSSAFVIGEFVAQVAEGYDNRDDQEPLSDGGMFVTYYLEPLLSTLHLRTSSKAFRVGLQCRDATTLFS